MSNDENTNESAEGVREVSAPTHCGPWTAPNGETQVIHVCLPGSSACQCGRHIYPARTRLL